MTFILVPSEYEKVRGFLLETVPGFTDSIEYDTLNEVERELTGVVCGAFTRFFTRFQEEERREGSLSERDAWTLECAYHAIDLLAQSGDEEVRTVLKDEVFENLDCGRECMALIRSRLEPQSQVLFDAVWNDSEPP